MKKNVEGHEISLSDDNRKLTVDGKEFPVHFKRQENDTYRMLALAYISTYTTRDIKFLWWKVGTEKIEHREYPFYDDKESHVYHGLIMSFKDYDYDTSERLHKEMFEWVDLRIRMWYTAKAKNKLVNSLLNGTTDVVAANKKFGL